MMNAKSIYSDGKDDKKNAAVKNAPMPVHHVLPNVSKSFSGE
jgi:hypothetical protein